MMDWKKLLSTYRIGMSGPGRTAVERSNFQRDFDRVVFSGSFRRLQDKTQVFPLHRADYVRTRLTHSLETSSIARSLGTAAGRFVCGEFDTGGCTSDDIGAIVAAAALAHDIGNPPLGHAGEEAIRYWFTDSAAGREMASKLTAEQCADIARYEGNAQGFRTLSRLEMSEQRGGMRLTCATLGAFSKYPCSSLDGGKSPGVAGKKFNFFCSENDMFSEMAEQCGLIQTGPRSWLRHPLAYLVEAADDIAYLVVDFEDGYRLGLIDYDELENFFIPLIASEKAIRYMDNLGSQIARVEYLRAQAIGHLVIKVAKCFEEHIGELMNGTLEKPLTECLDCSDILARLRSRSEESIYNNDKVAEVVIAGFEMVAGMLDVFMPSVEEVAAETLGSGKASFRTHRITDILPERSLRTNDEAWLSSPYERLMCVLDYIAGMTDSYAVSIYQKLKGITL